MKECTAGQVSYDTGAVRSADAESERYDLVSPTAIDSISLWFNRRNVTQDGGVFNVRNCVAEAVVNIYEFLDDDGGECGGLENAAINISAAQRVIDGVPPFMLNDNEGAVDPMLIRMIARACAEGAKKYSDFNWERGMPVSDLLNHALRHLVMWQIGDRSEPHLEHAAWNVAAAIHSDVNWPHLNVGRLRRTGALDFAKESNA